MSVNAKIHKIFAPPTDNEIREINEEPENTGA